MAKHFQSRMQQFARRFDYLAHAVDDGTEEALPDLRGKIGALLSHAVGQFDTAVSLLQINQTAPQASISGPEQMSRHGSIGVLAGTGKDRFDFPTLSTLVQNAIGRIIASNTTVQGTQRKRRGEVGRGLNVTTLVQDLLAGHVTPERTGCWTVGLDDDERLDLATTASNVDQFVAQVRQEGIESTGMRPFLIQLDESRHSALYRTTDIFMTDAEAALQAAEQLWDGRNPPSAHAVPLATGELPAETKQFASSH